MSTPLLLSNIPSLSCDSFDNVTLINSHFDTNRIGAFYKHKPLTHAHLYRENKLLSVQVPFSQATYVSEEEVIYGGFLAKHYGHFLTESLSRLWYAKNSHLPIVWSRGERNMKPWQLQTWQTEIFKKLGITNKHLFIPEPTLYKKVHFPQPGFMIKSYCHPELIQFLECHEEKEIEKGKYIYFSRVQSNPLCLNEKKIEKILEQRGWQIIYPEKISIEKQLDLISSAHVCCMIMGSAQHSLFLTKNTKTRFIILPRFEDITYDLVAHHKAENYFTLSKDFIIGKELMSDSRGIWSIDIDLLEKYLIETHDFTTNVENLPELFQRPCALNARHFVLPKIYYSANLNIQPRKKQIRFIISNT